MSTDLGLLAAATVLAMLAVIAAANYIAATRERDQVAEEVSQHTRLLEALNAEQAKLEDRADALVRDRFRHLKPVTLDRVLDLDQGIYRSVVFSRIRQGGVTRHEYRLTLENTGDSPQGVAYRLMLFNAMGVNIGRDTARLDRALAPGEVRTHGGVLDVFLSGDPSYYSLQAL